MRYAVQDTNENKSVQAVKSTCLAFANESILRFRQA